jgi:hypothetical protein
MPEPLTSQLVRECLEKLTIAFPRTVGNPAAMADIYRDGLRGLSGDSVREAVRRAIQEEEYVPKVAKLREIATAWEKVNRAHFPVQLEPESGWCPNCRTYVKTLNRWRPMTDKHFRPLTTPDDKYLYLEPYQRDLCECSAPCAYAPIDNLEPPVMLATGAAQFIMSRSVRYGGLPVHEMDHAAD